MQDEMINKSQNLRMILTRLAVGQDEKGDDNLYIQLRTELFSNRVTKNLLPDFVISCRVLNDFWPYINVNSGIKQG